LKLGLIRFICACNEKSRCQGRHQGTRNQPHAQSSFLHLVGSRECHCALYLVYFRGGMKSHDKKDVSQALLELESTLEAFRSHLFGLH
jgi:hypothetical protein